MSSDALAAIATGAWSATGRDAELPDAGAHKKRHVPQEGYGPETGLPCDYYDNRASRHRHRRAGAYYFV
jgi:hypothetical protein